MKQTSKIGIIGRAMLALAVVTSGAAAWANEEHPPHAPALGHRDGCSCGTLKFHSGVDWSAQAGMPIPVADEGVVVKVEENEGAVVYSPTGGFCGRYVVVKHSYPNGRTAYTRYAQLGRLVGKDGKAIRVGMMLKKGDKVGEIGKFGVFHFEVRPVGKGVLSASAAAKPLKVAPDLEWAWYHPADPSRFNFDAFAGRSRSGK